MNTPHQFPQVVWLITLAVIASRKDSRKQCSILSTTVLKLLFKRTVSIALCCKRIKPNQNNIEETLCTWATIFLSCSRTFPTKKAKRKRIRARVSRFNRSRKRSWTQIESLRNEKEKFSLSPGACIQHSGTTPRACVIIVIICTAEIH